MAGKLCILRTKKWRSHMFIRNRCFKKSCFADIILKSKVPLSNHHTMYCGYLSPVYLKRSEVGLLTFKLLFETGHCHTEILYLPVSETTYLGNCQIDTDSPFWEELLLVNACHICCEDLSASSKISCFPIDWKHSLQVQYASHRDANLAPFFPLEFKYLMTACVWSVRDYNDLNCV